MPIEIRMPALSPTMEEGTLARWLVKVGDKVSTGDVMAEIETDKATMEFEAVDEGTVAAIAVPEGSEGVKVGTVIATLAGEGEEVSVTEAAPEPTPEPAPELVPVPAQASAPSPEPTPEPAPAPAPASIKPSDTRIVASPLARRIAAQRGVDLAAITGSGPNGRIVKADVESAAGIAPATRATAPAAASAPVPMVAAAQDFGIPHEAVALSGMRKTIARRLTESKQQIPHIYLTVDIRLDALLKLRNELNTALEPQGVKLSVNDLMIKALAKALEAVPECNVQFAGDQMLQFTRADISVAVSIPNGLITPIITDAGSQSVSAISTRMKDLAARAREGKLTPAEYQGGTASLSNIGMYGIKQFDAVINPPQAMIMAIGAGEKRPCVIDDALSVATVMSATGSFDHRAIDGADAARFMQAFKQIIENPLSLVA
ncbi:MAG: pyruvate dehydrogenase complex dihydrolipoamide acetyltransferase [Caenibius sp.]